MDKENFKILKEIASLEANSAKLQDEIDGENRRIAFVNAQRTDRLEHLKRLNNKKEGLEAELDKLERDTDKNIKDLQRLNTNLHNATTVKEQAALEPQIATKEQEQVQIETRTNQIIDEIDQCENELKEASTYEKGSFESLEKLKIEVSEIVSVKEKGKAVLTKRIELLLAEIPEIFQTSYKKVSAKKLKYGPFSSIKDLKCNICSFSINKVLEVDVEENFKLKACPSCGRIFIPAKALY